MAAEEALLELDVPCEKNSHGFCVGRVAFIFMILELLYLALYFILWFPKAAFFFAFLGLKRPFLTCF